jgi:LPS export ABC transporter permease LptF/LPS export ABC transporter permease LptG
MRLLDRYIGREVASHAALGLAIFTFVFFVPQLVHLMELVVRHSGGVGTVSLLFLCTLPPVLVFTIPMAVLVGVLIGLGRLSSDSEIVALHASGISLRRLLVPVGLVALVGALVTILMTFWLSPASLRTLRRLQNKVLSSEVPFAVQPRVFDERFPHLILYVQDVEAAATRWRGVFLASSGGPGGTAIWFAKDALVISGREKNQLELHLGAGSAHEYDPRYPNRYNVTTFGDSDIPVDLSGTTAAPRNTSISVAEQYVPTLLADHGPTALESRVELENRIAFPAACLVFALLGVPIGVRPRRGGRAAGMILTLVLIAGYYFIWITGDHLARQGRIVPSAGIWAANFVAVLIGVFFFFRIENTRKTYIFGWLELLRIRRQRAQVANTALVPVSNGSLAPSPVSNGPVSFTAVSSSAVSNPAPSIAQPASRRRRIHQARSAVGFPMMIDIYLLQEFFSYFSVVLAGFLLIFDAFTLFDILGDISKNRVPFLTVLNYFRFLVPFLVYQLAPLATLVATLVTLAVLAKANEVIAFKASGISLYRLILPLALAGCLLAGGMFVLDNTFLPYANQRQDALRNEIKGRPAQTYFQPARQWIFGENDKIYNYELFDSDRQLFGGLNVFELDSATFQLRRRVYATRATWEPTENSWVLTGGWVREFNSLGRVSSFYPFKVFSLPELSEPPSYFRREVRQYYQLNWRQLGQYIASLRQAGFDISRLSVQWQKKFAFPLIAPIIVLLGAPFAFLVGTRGAIGGLALAVGISVVYWATAALFEAMGSIGQLPPLLAAWAPDAIFGFLAVYFSLRMPT